MNIKRIHKSKNYSIISNEILRRKDLSLKAKGLMSLILSLPDSWDLTVNGLVAGQIQILNNNISTETNRINIDADLYFKNGIDGTYLQQALFLGNG